jgi:GNAT superfamily N-acetyltransferase
MEIRKITESKRKTLEKDWLRANLAWLGPAKGRLLFTTMQKQKKNVVLGAFDRGKLVGYASGDTHGGVAHLRGLIIVEKHRGKGIAATLVRKFEQACKRAGCHKIYLMTARPFLVAYYRGLGFKIEARFKKDAAGLDWYRMYKPL